MSADAVAYYSEMLKKVSESEEWETDYLEKNQLISNYMDYKGATKYVTEYEKDYLESLGKK